MKFDLLVFYTPVPVSNLDRDKWCEKVREQYGHGLEIVHRARIASALEHPDNAWLCRDYLGLPFGDEPNLEALRYKVRAIEKVSLDQWKLQYGYNSQRQIQLTLRQESKDEGEKGNFLTLKGCCETIRRVRRVTLKGVPGAGKTITLLQIAEKLMEDSEGPVPIVFSLSEWAEANQGLLVFLAGRTAYQAAELSESQLSRLNSAGRLVFLLNGWNEISVEATTKAFMSLKGMIRDSPATAFLITTRDTMLTPPVTDPITIHVQPLEPQQRREIVEASNLPDSSALLNTIEHEPVLEEITRIPLFLSRVVELAKQGRAIPTSRYGIIHEFVESTEANPDYAVRLKEGPCSGRHHDYLQNISVTMCGRGTTTLGADAAMSSIGTCSNSLFQAGIIGNTPDARLVLDALVSHHLLVRSQTPTESSVRFSHQQFQEWFAAEWLYKQLSDLVDSGQQGSTLRFQEEILNDPFWQESLRFLSERLNPVNGFEARTELGNDLVRLTIPVGLILAAELARLIGWENLTSAREQLAKDLRALYGKAEKVAANYAVAGMLATGSADFADIYEPFLESSNDQTGIQFYRMWQPFPLSALGKGLSLRMQRWNEDRRAGFIHEMMLEPDATHFELVVGLARNDPSPKVWIAALQMLAWHGAFDRVLNILENERSGEWPEEVFTEVLDIIPSRYLSSILPHMKSALAYVSQSNARLFILETLDDGLDPGAESLLKQELDREPSEMVLAKLLPRLHRKVPDWVLSWLGNRMLEGKYWDHRWVPYLDRASPKLLASLGAAACNTEIDLNTAFKRVNVLIELNAEPATKVLVSRYLDIHTEIYCSPTHDAWERERGLGEVRDLPFDSLVRACRSIDEAPMNPCRVEALLDLLRPSSRSGEVVRPSISDEDREWIRKLILEWDASVPPLATDECGRNRKAHLATLLGGIGTPEDATIIDKWIQEDLALFRKAKNRIWWTGWYADALANLNCDQAADVLLKLLEDLACIGDASRGLMKMVRSTDQSPPSRLLGGPDYKGVVEKRRLRQSRTITEEEPSKRRKYAKAILEAVTRRVGERQSSKTGVVSLWGIGDGTIPLAHLAEEECIPILLQAGNPDALTVLVTRGLILPGPQTFEAVNPIISRLEADFGKGSSNDWWLAEQGLALLLLSDQPKLGVDRIRQLSGRILKSYEVRDLVRLLGLCQANDAAEYLAELSDNYEVLRFCSYEYISALVESKHKVAWRALLSLLDDLGQDRIVDREIRQVVAMELGKALGRVAKEDEEILAHIKSRCEGDPHGDEWHVLLTALQEINTEEAVLSACRLARDRAGNPMWGEPPYGFEDLFINKVPTGSQGSYYQRPKPLANVRRTLMQQALYDPDRKRSSLVLLIWMELLWLDLGRPAGEPHHPDIGYLIGNKVPWPLLN